MPRTNRKIEHALTIGEFKLIWNLPNNSLIVNIAVRGQSCSATFATPLKPGMTQVSMFDGTMYHYCTPPVMTSSICEIK